MLKAVLEGDGKALERRNHQGKTALMLAVEGNHSDIAKYLLDEYADIDVLKIDSLLGNTVLHWACINNNVELAQ